MLEKGLSRGRHLAGLPAPAAFMLYPGEGAICLYPKAKVFISEAGIVDADALAEGHGQGKEGREVGLLGAGARGKGAHSH